MASIRHDGGVLSGTGILTRRAQQAGSAADRTDTSIQAADNTPSSQTYTKEAVSKLIAAYLDTPTHISFNLCCW